MATLGKFFTSLLGKLSALADWLLAVFKQIFVDVWAMVTDVACWFVEGSLGVAASALSAIDTPFNPQTYYGMIPAEAGQVLGLVGITQGVTIIVSALLVRFVLQTIPFVRWGS